MKYYGITLMTAAVLSVANAQAGQLLRAECYKDPAKELAFTAYLPTGSAKDQYAMAYLAGSSQEHKGKANARFVTENTRTHGALDVALNVFGAGKNLKANFLIFGLQHFNGGPGESVPAQGWAQVSSPNGLVNDFGFSCKVTLAD